MISARYVRKPLLFEQDDDTCKFGLVVSVNVLGNFTQRSDSDDTNVKTLRVLQHVAKKLEEMRKVILETDNDTFEDSEEDIRANFAV